MSSTTLAKTPAVSGSEAQPKTDAGISYHRVAVNGLDTFYREAGRGNKQTIVLLHGFPSSSHMFRDLIPMLSDRFHVVAPDYVGFGHSAQPSVRDFTYTFDNLAAHVEKLLFETLGLKKFAIYVQDYGAPVGYRIASRHPEAIEGIIVQNGNAYTDGIGPAFDSMKPFWANRNAENEKPVRGLLAAGTTQFQYTHGVQDVSKVSPDSYTFDQALLDRPGNDAIQLELLHNYPTNVSLYLEWHEYFRKHQPRMLIVWGKNDPFFTPQGAEAYLRDLPNADLNLLDSGHFALEDKCAEIAGSIRQFFGKEK